MTSISDTNRIAWTAILAALIAGALQAESRFAVPFENFRRTHDSGALYRTMSSGTVMQAKANLYEDIGYLIPVCADGQEPILQDQALLQLYLIAFQLANATEQPINALRPAIPIFESHLDEALADINSKWAMALFTLTGLAGLQPDPRVIPVFYRMSEANDPRLREKALFALARLSPRPPEAKRILLQKAATFDSGERIEILSYALDDPDFLGIFAKSLESKDVSEQRRATKLLVHAGVSAKPALEILLRLQQRPDLDTQVSANIQAAINQIQGSK